MKKHTKRMSHPIRPCNTEESCRLLLDILAFGQREIDAGLAKPAEDVVRDLRARNARRAGAATARSMGKGGVTR